MRKWFALLMLSVLCLNCAFAETGETVDVYIRADTVLNSDFSGFGIEWDPHAESRVTDSEWQTLTERVEYLQPELVRCMVLARWYLKVSGDTVKADLDNYEMRRAMKVLDWCQEHGVTVVWGDWGPAGRMRFDDRQWAEGMALCLDRLINEMGYTCIKYVNIGNEPDGSWSDCGNFRLYAAGVRNLYAELEKRGLLEKVSVSGPDIYGEWSWLDKAADELDGQLGNFDFHWYPDAAGIAAGNPEIRLRRKLKNLSDKLGGRHVFICETGIADGKTAADQQPNVREFWYGVALSDALVQYTRAGISGVIVWDLEDSMHPTGKEYKTWGFYNMKGGESEQALRPWYYAYSLLCRLFRSGMKVLATECSDDWGIRVLAAEDEEGGFSIAVVNNSDEPKTVRLFLNDMKPFEQMYIYRNFESDHPEDEKGFPAVSEVRTGALCGTEMTVEMPTNGTVYLTTYEQN